MSKKCPFGDKNAYPTEARAKMVRATLEKHGKSVHGLRIYRCPNCYKWHFTSQLKYNHE